MRTSGQTLTRVAIVLVAAFGAGLAIGATNPAVSAERGSATAVG